MSMAHGPALVRVPRAGSGLQLQLSSSGACVSLLVGLQATRWRSAATEPTLEHAAPCRSVTHCHAVTHRLPALLISFARHHWAAP